MDINKDKVLKQGLFKEVGVQEGNEKWDKCQTRLKPISRKPNEIRTEFERDYTRILHCKPYRRLKHKTQVFFATNNDHVCTRIEHVNHVATISKTIAKYLGLNTELVSAIAIGHDLGHAPFGHEGELILTNIINSKNMDARFWHEGNSLRFVDKCCTMPDSHGHEQNMNLTYGVRDGIVCHCGEVDQNLLHPRDEFIDLETIKLASEVSPYTWEGCVVKLADKIAYLGRDLEDALAHKILSFAQIKELKKIAESYIGKFRITELNNTNLTHDFIIDLCKLSSPEDGIRFSPEYLELMKAMKAFNYENLYYHKKLLSFKNYAHIVLTSIAELLFTYYKAGDTLNQMHKDFHFYPLLITNFEDWLMKYSDLNDRKGRNARYHNDIIYNIENENDYNQSVIDFISGMTDHFAIKVFNEIITF